MASPPWDPAIGSVDPPDAYLEKGEHSDSCNALKPRNEADKKSLDMHAMARMQILGARRLHQLNQDPQQWEMKLQVSNSDELHAQYGFLRYYRY